MGPQGIEKDDGFAVKYNSENHFSVLTQMHGSIWPKVFLYCIFNVCICLVVEYIKIKLGVHIPITAEGHKSFMGMFVAFLVVSRVTISLGRYNEARQHLSVMYREGRELVNYVAIFTSDMDDEGSKQWRHDMAYRACLLLRTAMAVIDFGEQDAVRAWEVPELGEFEKEYVMKSLYLNNGTSNAHRWAHQHRGESEENMRVPIRLAYLLRNTIVESKGRLPAELAPWQYTKLLNSVDTFMNGFYGMRKFLTTPFPFPLLQMARTFMFAYVFTISLALVNDPSHTVFHCCVVFLVTYGFLGLETVSIELDDPFGDDANDFDNYGMALTAFEDTYLTINDVDGEEWADKLRYKMHDNTDETPTTETTWLLGYKMV
mmetsp:Transcript_24580/g.36076  ORF Transcript_24580/g.36076 Transcript_24580/m.36076 type:complete len:373 (+) Transcript_24580:72-1190(+)|eukprot:CAMPEP_0195516880 /NCGR_PEP_ID=MMETSP0794_2-20130614/8885_1 /TAXON_ID=515487 /ORGANISM="Stephanopyxis turris, Strain CCMP 815" /LENGTH=372 /DNA_ID=CAMNT_0040645589 /DNA_START=47 /DNA_END=1165 /DNA_ORIENTATION=-